MERLCKSSLSTRSVDVGAPVTLLIICPLSHVQSIKPLRTRTCIYVQYLQLYKSRQSLKGSCALSHQRVFANGRTLMDVGRRCKWGSHRVVLRHECTNDGFQRQMSEIILGPKCNLDDRISPKSVDQPSSPSLCPQQTARAVQSGRQRHSNNCPAMAGVSGTSTWLENESLMDLCLLAFRTNVSTVGCETKTDVIQALAAGNVLGYSATEDVGKAVPPSGMAIAPKTAPPAQVRDMGYYCSLITPRLTTPIFETLSVYTVLCSSAWSPLGLADVCSCP